MMHNDFDEYIANCKRFILEKDAWTAYDASFLITQFSGPETQKEDEFKRKQYEKAINAGVIAKTLKPIDSDKKFFWPIDIFKWAESKGIWDENIFNGFFKNYDLKKKHNTGPKTKESTYINIIGVLLDCINGEVPGLDIKLIKNQSELIEKITSAYSGYSGLSRSNLEKTFARVKRHAFTDMDGSFDDD
ncbi:hypothetical protein [Caldithrix abyssi]